MGSRAAALPFAAVVRKVGINPYVRVPAAVVKALLAASGKRAGPVPVKGTLQGRGFTAHVVLFRGLWRLYLNGPMRAAAGVEVGDECTVSLRADGAPRAEPMNPALERALASNRGARRAFEALAPSRRKEILRYLNALKRPETLERNVAKAVAHLCGEKVTGLVAVTR